VGPEVSGILVDICCELKGLEEAEMESFLPFLDIASARHAQSDLRLFAN